MQSSSQRRRRKSSSNPIADVPVVGNRKADDALNKGRGLIQSLLAAYLPRALAFAYGSCIMAFFFVQALYSGYYVNRPSKKFWSDLENERRRIWNLSISHPSGLYHAFRALDTGVKLHYLTNAQEESPKKTKDLVIFLHGFPDSASLWSSVIGHIPSLKDCTLVAPDLPGFGGSDSLSSYGSNEILQTMLDFCLAMREQYLSEDYAQNGKVIIVGFDWGGVIAFRLASEAPDIADRFIIANSALPAAALRNMRERFETASSIFSSWRRSPLKYKLLLKAFEPVRPVYVQLKRSAYIFTFQLPLFIATQTITRCNLWLIRLMHSLALGHKSIKDTREVISGMAGYMGPMSVKDDRVPSGLKNFGESVCRRSRSAFPFQDTIRYYREGLATQPWNKDLESILKLSDIADFNKYKRRRASVGSVSQLAGCLGVPVTVVFGTKDVALDTRIMLEGLDDYMTGGSQIIRLPVGHWVPHEGDGPKVLATVVTWALEDERSETLGQALTIVSSQAVISMSK